MTDSTDLADQVAEQLRAEILRAFDAVREGLAVGLLEQAILARDIQRAVAQVGLQELANAMAKLQTALGPLREAGWEAALKELPKALLSEPLLKESLGAAALRDPALLAPTQALDLSRIQGITEETRQALSQILQQGIANGVHPTVLARQIRSEIGLNRQQVQAVANYRARLVLQARKPDQIGRMVARYERKLLNQRARTIAQTETARARNEGFRLQTQRLVDAGTLDAARYQQEWITAHDERTCPICQPLDGERVDIGGAFVTDVGLLPGPPAHVLCRCTARLVSRGFREGLPTAPARDVILARLGTLQKTG